MPEGDTIFRAARALHAALAGRKVTGFSSPLPLVSTASQRLRLLGQTITAVEPRGKHLLMRFSAGPVLHTHMRMNGSWHLYRRGSRWQRPRIAARAVVETAEVQAVCFAAPVVELLSAAEAARHPALARLGEDLLAAGFDPVRARAALRDFGEDAIGTALLDQTALAGIGNVYRSEVLFLCGQDPFAAVSSVSNAQLDRLIATAQAQMKRNLGRGMRRTTSELSGERLWVYGRTGRSCRKCSTPVTKSRQGELARTVYWCAGCQRGQVRRAEGCGRAARGNG